jgi:NAD(P)-dependent dehydrogenase (short-subunit alcohol dehydrogenase family)
MAKGFLQFWADQRVNLPIAPTTESCRDKVFIVTGSNTGLGFECAKHLVRLRPKKVIMAVRSVKRGEDAKVRIEKATGNAGIAEVWELDLVSHESTKKFAARVSTLDRVDAIIHNASVGTAQFVAAEGIETSLTVNVISTMLLAVLLLPKLQESGRRFGITPHMSFIGSGAGFDAKDVLEKIDGDIFDGLSQPDKFDFM